MVSIIALVLMAAFPYAAMVAAKKVRILGVFGPVFLCYAGGFLLSFALPDTSIAMDVSEIMVPIAIPMMLLCADLRSVKKLAKPMLVSFLLVVLSVSAVAALVCSLFANRLDNVADLGGMMIGLYTGGTPNLFAIGMALGVPDSTIVLANTSDMVVGGVYFLLLLTIIPKFVKRFYPERKQIDAQEAAFAVADNEAPLTGSFWQKLAKRLPALGVGVLCLGAAAGLALLITGELDTAIIMLVVTSLGIGLSFVEKVRKLPGAFSTGQYLIYVFSFGLGLSFDLSVLSKSALFLLALFAVVQFGTVLVHMALARICKIDGATTVITSTAGIYGPAFIIPVAAALKDKSVIVPGLICGILGYAIGNYLGIFMGGLFALWM